MKTFDDLINELYNNLLQGVEEQYSDSSLRERFTAYMYNEYGFFASKLSSGDIPAGSIESHLKRRYDWEVRDWGNLTDARKYARFTPDEQLIQAETLSHMVFASAIDKAKGNVPDSDVIEENEKRIALIRSYVNGVREENQETARWLLSEAIVDANYASGASAFTSFRLREWLHSHGYFEHENTEA